MIAGGAICADGVRRRRAEMQSFADWFTGVWEGPSISSGPLAIEPTRVDAIVVLAGSGRGCRSRSSSSTRLAPTLAISRDPSTRSRGTSAGCRRRDAFCFRARAVSTRGEARAIAASRGRATGGRWSFVSSRCHLFRLR